MLVSLINLHHECVSCDWMELFQETPVSSGVALARMILDRAAENLCYWNVRVARPELIRRYPEDGVIDVGSEPGDRHNLFDQGQTRHKHTLDSYQPSNGELPSSSNPDKLLWFEASGSPLTNAALLRCWPRSAPRVLTQLWLVAVRVENEDAYGTIDSGADNRLLRRDLFQAVPTSRDVGRSFRRLPRYRNVAVPG